MQDFGFCGSMYQWPKIFVYEDVPKTLEYLAANYVLGVATNANDSGAGAVRKALDRGGIGKFIGPIYSSGEVGFQKPQPEFFGHILKDLGLQEEAVCMVGDSFVNDVVPALGIQSFWLNRRGEEIRQGHGYTTIKSLDELMKHF